MSFKTFENINVRIMYSKNNDNHDLYDGKVLFVEQEPIKFFSVDDKELNDILKAFDILNERRFGRIT